MPLQGGGGDRGSRKARSRPGRRIRAAEREAAAGRRSGAPGPAPIDERERSTDAPLGLAKPLARFLRGAARELADDPHRPLAQLGVGHLQVHHPPLPHLPQRDHRGGGEQIQGELGGGAGLEPRRAGDELRAGVEDHAHVDLRRAGHGRGIAGEEQRPRLASPGLTQGREHEGRSTAGGDPADHVPGTDAGARDGSRRPAGASSSAPSTARWSARAPPAIRARTRLGDTPNVGGSSAASRAPSRPLVPAPT